jgi:hypothetical protein
VLITNAGPDPAWVLLTTAAASPTGSAGSAGALSFTVSSNSDIALGQATIGTNIPAGAYVTGISGTTITVNVPLTGVVSGTVNFVTQVTTHSGQVVTTPTPIALAYGSNTYISAITNNPQGRAVLSVSVGD